MAGFRTYQPELPDVLIHELWRLKQQTGVPMTRLIREAVERYLADLSRTADADDSAVEAVP